MSQYEPGIADLEKMQALCRPHSEEWALLICLSSVAKRGLSEKGEPREALQCIHDVIALRLKQEDRFDDRK